MTKKLSERVKTENKTSGTEEKKGKKKRGTDKRFESIHSITAALHKHFNNNSLIMHGSQIPYINKVKFMEPELDYVSDGGIPIGRMTEFLGNEHTGKTRNALKALSQFQKYCFNCHTDESLSVEWVDDDGIPKATNMSCSCGKPKTAVSVFVDYEGTTDPKFMENFGIQTSGVLYFRPELPSQAIDIVDAYLRSPEVGLIIFDSVGAMSSDDEIEKSYKDNAMNKGALTLNKGVRKWQASLNTNTNQERNSPTTLIIVNQSYSSIGVYSHEVAQGGRGLRHGKGLSLKTRVVEKVKDKKNNILGVHVGVENTKNKTGIPYRKRQYYLNLDSSSSVGYCQIDLVLQTVELAIEYGIIEQRGGWFYLGEYKWQGRNKVHEAMAASIDEFNDLKKLVEENLYG